MENKKWLVVTTEKGVFFGLGIPSDAENIRLEQCQMCIYWPESNRGVAGLAGDGPKSGAKIGPAAPAITIRGVTAVMETTEKAKIAWQAEPWN